MSMWRHAWRASVCLPIAGLAISVFPIPAFAQDFPASINAPKWTPWVEFGGYYGTDNSTRGEAVLWAPLTQSQSSLLFGEARGKQFEQDMREGNFAIGYRQMMPDGWNLGIWGGYDVRRSPFGNTFHQLAGGIEALSDRWDFRANAYLPLNDRENVATSSIMTPVTSVVDMTGPQIGLITTVDTITTSLDEVALWGFDAEIGTKLFSTAESLSGPRHELRVYAGAFHFDHSDIDHSVTGPRVRTEWRVDNLIESWSGSRLTFEGEYSHDKVRDNRFEIGARLRLPFGDAGTRPAYALTAQERRMSEGLERDTDIVSDRKTTQTATNISTIEEDVEDAETGVRFDRVVTVDATGNLSTTSTNAGANSLIIADGTAGNLNGNHTLQGNQTILGGGETLQIRGLTSGNLVDFTAAGSKPTLTASTGNVITVGGDSVHLAGLNVSGGTHGVWADSRSNTVISRLNISSPWSDGVFLNGTGGSTRIQDTTITGAGDDTIQINAASHVLTVRNSELINSSYGLYVTAANTTLEIDNVQFSNITYWALAPGGISYQTTINISNSEFSGHFGSTILYLQGTVSGTGNTASGATYPSVCYTGYSWTGSIEFDGTTYTHGSC